MTKTFCDGCGNETATRKCLFSIVGSEQRDYDLCTYCENRVMRILKGLDMPPRKDPKVQS